MLLRIHRHLYCFPTREGGGEGTAPHQTDIKQTLDLRTTKCPLNFVKTRLALEKLQPGDIIEVWIAAEGESAMNIPSSIQQEGHTVLKTETDETGNAQRLWIQKN